MRLMKLGLPLFSFVLAGCGLLGGPIPDTSVQTPAPRRGQPTFPPTWTLPAPTATPTTTPTPTQTLTLTPEPSLTPAPTITRVPPGELAAALATQMAGRPSPTPMLACQVRATVAGIPLADAPILGEVQATMDTGQAYQISAWLHPSLFLSLNGAPQGWIGIPREGVVLEGQG